jgi:hypothetical protein
VVGSNQRPDERRAHNRLHHSTRSSHP